MSSPLPRESNPVLVRSIMRNSISNVQKAMVNHTRFQNVGSAERLRTTGFALLAQILRVAFVDAVNRPNLYGAALASHKRKCANEYLAGLEAWAVNYDKASGFSAVKRVRAFIATLPRK